MAAPLPWHGRMHVALHNAGAQLGLPGWHKVATTLGADHVVVQTECRALRVPAMDRWLHYRWGWTARIARLFRHFGIDDRLTLQDGDQVIDIGANVGEFSLGAASRGAQVLAIEPDPTVFACLRANVSGHSVTPCNALVWKEPAELTFYSAPAKADSSVFVPQRKQRVQALTLTGQPLDALTADLDRIDLIKCDAEGAEPEVLQGATDTLARTQQIALDTGPERAGAETGEACGKILAGHGFQVSHSASGRKITYGVRP